MRDVLYVLGAIGAAYYAFLWVRDTAERRYQEREDRAVREARIETAHWLGFQEGADHFNQERPEPRVMSAELFDVFTRDSQVECQDDWSVLREFQQGKVDGFRQTAEMEIELDLAEHDIEHEFHAWLRGREAA